MIEQTENPMERCTILVVDDNTTNLNVTLSVGQIAICPTSNRLGILRFAQNDM